MDPKITQEILDDLIPSLENLETRSTAVLEFLRSEGIASDEKLAPYFEKAKSASNVRWLGVRVRIERLLSAAEKQSADKKGEEDKKPVASGSPGDQAERKADKAEKKPANVSAAEPEPNEKPNSEGPQISEDNRTESKENDKEKHSESPREQAAQVANPPANNAGKGDQGGDNQSAPAENPKSQKVA